MFQCRTMQNSLTRYIWLRVEFFCVTLKPDIWVKVRLFIDMHKEGAFSFVFY